MKRLIGEQIINNVYQRVVLAEEQVELNPSYHLHRQRTGNACSCCTNSGSCTSARRIAYGQDRLDYSTQLQLLCTTPPGLVLFYGGLGKCKYTPNTMAMSFVTYCIVSFLWIAYGLSLSFGTDVGGIIGSNSKSLQVLGVNIFGLATTIPNILLVYHMNFAAITVCPASGAYIQRMSFLAWVMFSCPSALYW